MGDRRIRQAVLAERYEFTLHALEEMDDDDLTETDVRQSLLDGQVVAKLTADPRGPRLVVRGELKARVVEVVVRFLPSGVLRVITVYLVRSDEG